MEVETGLDMVAISSPSHVLCLGGRGARLRNEEEHRKGALPIAQQRHYAMSTRRNASTLAEIFRRMKSTRLKIRA